MSEGMPSWEEWNEQLTEEQRKYSLYKVLADLYHRECQRDELCRNRLGVCETHFAKLEKRKWFDRVIAIGVGIGTGIATALGIKVGQ